MVTEDYCSFELSKLLKEKGFNEECFSLYNPDGMLIQSGIRLNNIQVGRVKGSYSAPTLQMAMKWLREVRNIFVCIVLLEDIDRYGFTVENTVNKKYIATSKNDGYSTYEEVTEAAIKYCLEHLI